MKPVRFDQKDLLRTVIREFIHEGYSLDDLDVTLSTFAPVDLDMLEECRAEFMPLLETPRQGALPPHIFEGALEQPAFA